MANPQYTKEEYWALYKKLPEELRETLFSVERTEQIEKACARYGIPEDAIPEIVKEVGNVLFGLTPLDKFPEILKTALGLKKDVAQRVSQEINLFVFNDVRPALQRLHNIQSESGAKTAATQTINPTQEDAPPPEKDKSTPDPYRESVE